jgi:uncharacterized membrane protein (DUF106 family)
VESLNGMGYGMMGSFWGFFLNLLLILLIVGAVVVLLNRSGYAAPRDNERIVKMEKDIEEIKKTVEEIKSKLEEI